MRNEWVLSKDHLSYWLRQLRNERELIGPLRDGGKDILFRTVDMLHEIVLDCPSSLPSPKEFLFPQYEAMFSCRGLSLSDDSEGKREISDLRDRTRRVIFGVRSCDVSAVRLLDTFCLGTLRDPYYEERRRNTFLISLVCNNPDPTCFCLGLGTGPYLEEGFDIQMTDLGDRYFVQAGSPEAVRTVRAMNFFFRKPRKVDYEDQYEVFLSSKARFQKRINLEGPRQAILSGKVGDDFWQEATERCFECGGCSYSCPVCTCFTVTDRIKPEGIERARLWDSCLFKGFTRMAGGVLPNEKRVQRTKRWYYHKLIHYPHTTGKFGCVGCGRCAVACPGKIDMARTATKIKGLALKEEVE